MPTFYEFFAGGGMARAGLGEGWQCVFANDFDAKKAASYQVNWGVGHLRVGDVAKLTIRDLPDGSADLAWASFPCQDLSLAGDYAGLQGERSGTFWAFWKLMRSLAVEKRAPRIIVLENVCGALTSHGGKDFAAIGDALAKAGYRFGAMVIDAVHFVPQSRPRLFLVAVHTDAEIPRGLRLDQADPAWHTRNVVTAWTRMPAPVKRSWIWWKLPVQRATVTTLADLIEADPEGVDWHPATETRRILDMMAPLHLARVREAMAYNRPAVGCVYRRTREGVQRAEVRFDGIAGCLRTPGGGSSRQILLVVKGRQVRSRLLSPREAARLMGLPDSYRLPAKYNEAYHLTGDGVVVPVVRFLAEHLLEPLLKQTPSAVQAA